MVLMINHSFNLHLFIYPVRRDVLNKQVTKGSACSQNSSGVWEDADTWGHVYLFTSVTYTALGFKIGMMEGRYLHFEKISQLHKLIVLNFLQKSLDRMALMEEKKPQPFFLEPLKCSILEQSKQIMKENRLSNHSPGRKAGNKRMRA